jgi:glycosyltransferase involved in cell wall biosynthesis
MALTFTRDLAFNACVYDNMDELSAFVGAPAEMLEMEQALFDRADVVFTGGHSLYEAKRDRHSNIHAFPSSVDTAHFAIARSREIIEPEDQAPIPHPRLGFFGVIDERFDVALLGALARLRSDWQFVMIGPVAKIDGATLPRLPNIHWLGCKPYSDLPRYLAGWNVGLMPFALNASTRFISPTKTPEFLAAGIPVVCSPIPDVVRCYGDPGLVQIATDAEDFASKAQALLGGQPRWLERVDAQLALSSWDTTWESMRGLVRRVTRKSARSFLAEAAE